MHAAHALQLTSDIIRPQYIPVSHTMLTQKSGLQWMRQLKLKFVQTCIDKIGNTKQPILPDQTTAAVSDFKRA